MQRLKDRIGNIIRLTTFLFFSPPTFRLFCVRLCDWCLCVRVIKPTPNLFFLHTLFLFLRVCKHLYIVDTNS